MPNIKTLKSGGITSEQAAEVGRKGGIVSSRSLALKAEQTINEIMQTLEEAL